MPILQPPKGAQSKALRAQEMVGYLVGFGVHGGTYSEVSAEHGRQVGKESRWNYTSYTPRWDYIKSHGWGFRLETPEGTVCRKSNQDSWSYVHFAEHYRAKVEHEYRAFLLAAAFVVTAREALQVAPKDDRAVARRNFEEAEFALEQTLNDLRRKGILYANETLGFRKLKKNP